MNKSSHTNAAYQPDEKQAVESARADGRKTDNEGSQFFVGVSEITLAPMVYEKGHQNFFITPLQMRRAKCYLADAIWHLVISDHFE